MKLFKNFYFQLGLKIIATLFLVYMVGVAIRLGWNSVIYIVPIIFIYYEWNKKNKWRKATLQLCRQFATKVGEPEELITEREIKKIYATDPLTVTCKMPEANMTFIIHRKLRSVPNQIKLVFLLATDAENRWRAIKNEVTDFAHQLTWIDTHNKLSYKKKEPLHACTLTVPLSSSPTPKDIDLVTDFFLQLIHKHAIVPIEQYIYFRDTLDNNHYYLHHRNCSIIDAMVLNETQEYLTLDPDEIPDNIDLTQLSATKEYKDIRLISKEEFDKLIQEFRSS